MTEPLGLAGAAVGQRVSAQAGAPALAGTVEATGVPEWPELLVRLDAPGPGIAHLVPHAMMGQVFLTIRFFLYGDGAAEAAAAAEPVWQRWLGERFPPAEEASAAEVGAMA